MEVIGDERTFAIVVTDLKNAEENVIARRRSGGSQSTPAIAVDWHLK